MRELLSPRQFAEAIGVSESSVRRWADGGRIKMTRTAGGHRKITRAEALRFIREIGADVLRPELLEIGEPVSRRGRTRAFAEQDEQLFQALREGEADLVVGLLNAMHLNGVSVAEICDQPLRAAMLRIGEMWPSDKRSIFVEHRASKICMDALNRLRASLPKPAANAPIAIGGAPEHDPYALASSMVAAVLADIGLKVTDLGPNTPLDVLTDSALELNASLVWISTTSQLPRTAMNEALAKCARRLSRRKIHLVVGGQSLRKYALPDRRHVHAFSSTVEMAGFAKSLV